MKLDEWKPPSRLSRRECYTALRDIKSATEAYLSDPEVRGRLKDVADALVSNRRTHSRTDCWKLVSTGTQFRCMYEGYHSVMAHKMRLRESILKSHLKKCHGVSEADLGGYVRRGHCD